MPKTIPVSSRANAKQATTADYPIQPNVLSTLVYGPVASTASQNTITLNFAVDQANKQNFHLFVDGKRLSEGSANDYTFTSILPNNTSATIQLNQILTAGLNIYATYLGLLMPNYSLASIQAQVNSNSLLLPKNYLINSAFDYWQRNTTGTVGTGSSAYVSVDRWFVKNALGTSGVITCSQVAGSLPMSKYGCSVQITTAPTVAQVNGCELWQVIENMNSIELLGQIISGSVNVKALGNVNQVGIQFAYNTSEAKPNTMFGTEQVFSVNTSTFTLGQIVNQSVGTAPTSSGVVGMRIRITGVSTGNPWDLNNGFVVEQAQLNVGTIAATWARSGRNAGEELEFCQRYYAKSFPLGTVPAANTANAGIGGVNTLSGSAGGIGMTWSLPTTMRNAGMTINTYNPYAASSAGASGSGSGNYPVSAYAISANEIYFNNGSAGPSVTGQMSLNATADCEI